jgi:hypothetical protein
MPIALRSEWFDLKPGSIWNGLGLILLRAVIVVVL